MLFRSTAVWNNGFFLQDGSGAWNGIFVYEFGINIDQGEEININAIVEEYYYKTELNDIIEYTVISSGNTLPQAVSLPTIDVNQEDYEGVLVQVDNAECTNYDPDDGEWLVDDGSGEIMINDLMYAFVPVIGEFDDIIGVVDYSYSSFKIEPRYSSDISIASWIQEDIVNVNYNLNNYPNPFNPTTTISFELNTESTENTEIGIYNLKGQKVKSFEINQFTNSPVHQVTWNGTDNNEQPVSSGIYFYTLISGDHKITKKMLLMK